MTITTAPFASINARPDPARQSAPAPWRILVIDDRLASDGEANAPSGLIAAICALREGTFFGRPVALRSSTFAQSRTALGVDADLALVLLGEAIADRASSPADAAWRDLVGEMRQAPALEAIGIMHLVESPDGDGAEPAASDATAEAVPVVDEFVGAVDCLAFAPVGEPLSTCFLPSVAAALSAYQLRRELAEVRRGQNEIGRATESLMGQKGIRAFGASLLAEIGVLLGRPVEGFFCVLRSGTSKADDSNGAAACEFFAPVAGTAGRPLADCGLSLTAHTPQTHRSCLTAPGGGEMPPSELVAQSRAQRGVAFSGHATALYLHNSEQPGVVYFTSEPAPDTIERELLTLFATTVSAAFGKVRLVELICSATHVDGLTQLSNRTRFILDLDTLAASEEPNSVVVLLDLEHFADINDGLGHDTGNALLMAIAQRLRLQLGDTCKLARIGADVFGLIGPEDRLNPVFLQKLFATPFEVSGHSLAVSVSIGLSRVLEGGLSGISLLKRASIALNRAKSSLHGHHEYFIPEMEDSPRRRIEIIRQLREDFAARRLTLWYQPQVSLLTGKVVGLEALARWPAADGNGFVQPPSVFIPLAEYSGLIIDIGEWVVGEACAAFCRLRKAGIAPEHIAVNVSMPQFRSAKFARLIGEMTARYALPPGALELEITESLAMDEPKIVASNLRALRDAGARLAIDDFGTGYSSLSHLRELPIDCLKIDQAFVKEIGKEVVREGSTAESADAPASASIGPGLFAEMIIALGHKLDIDIVAEGVETAAQAAFLKAQGCTLGQGYYFAKPMPLDALIDWLRNPVALARE
ncbi:EAL domain-containing protein [Rhodocyclus tenuis]|uniref:EAL domain-containing protein n=1 Tax=Rhodocyclus gracilis TaxID=2929842 RepID=A0ABX0WF74_9RHOO|nr:EAL domain-containing protein [Rhodocyclus gracilis]NJA88376.1 EAL domain-containing protein [Rhodocyclus gracilis]